MLLSWDTEGKYTTYTYDIQSLLLVRSFIVTLQCSLIEHSSFHKVVDDYMLARETVLSVYCLFSSSHHLVSLK